MNILKAEGFKFPALKESDAMFSADTAPEWAEGEVCHRFVVVLFFIVSLARSINYDHNHTKLRY